jgi:hypothetical protein
MSRQGFAGRVRSGQDSYVTRAKFHTAFTDERRLDTVERLILLAREAGGARPATRARVSVAPVSASGVGRPCS